MKTTEIENGIMNMYDLSSLKIQQFFDINSKLLFRAFSREVAFLQRSARLLMNAYRIFQKFTDSPVNTARSRTSVQHL